MKQITLAGNIGKDAELRQTQSGDPVCSFNVAVTDPRDKENTTWFTCTLWGKRAQALSQYLTKGSKLALTGDLSTREYEGKTYLQVRVGELTLQGKPQGQSGSGYDSGNDGSGYGAGGRPGGGSRDLDDEIPFDFNRLA